MLVQSGERYRFAVEFVARKPLPSVCIGFLIRSSWGVDLIGTDTRFLACPGLPDRMRPGERCRAVLEMPLSFAPGTYFSRSPWWEPTRRSTISGLTAYRSASRRRRFSSTRRQLWGFQLTRMRA